LTQKRICITITIKARLLNNISILNFNQRSSTYSNYALNTAGYNNAVLDLD